MKTIYQKSEKINIAAWVAAMALVTASQLEAVNITGDTVVGNLTVTGSSEAVNVTATGWGLFKEGIDIGPGNEALLNWSPGPGTNDGTILFDTTRSEGTYLWRDSMTSSSAANKMKLNESNVLSLYNSAGSVVGISLEGNTGKINLSGSAGGVYLGGVAMFTSDYPGSTVIGDSSTDQIRLFGSVSMSNGSAEGLQSTAMSGGSALGNTQRE